MFSISVFTVLLLFTVTIIASKNVEGSQPIMQRTVEVLFTERSQITYPGSCKIFRASPQQNRICKRDPGLSTILAKAKDQAIETCEEAFQYDRWNCSLVFNQKAKRSIFKKIFRETAFVHALMAAAITHAVSKGCASGNLSKCSCVGSFGKNTTWQWKRSGCSDDFKYGKRLAKNFLDFKHAGSDQIGEILKQDIMIGVNAIGEQMREVCKCHGFSGSCTTKTCWKRLGPFNSALGVLKKQYHHAVKKKLMNYTTKRAATPKVRRRLNIDRKNLVYLQRTPNLCVSTKGRVCRDRDNCATLCCGRGYVKSKRSVTSRCRCKMVSCCYVECDTCHQEVDHYTCQ